MYETNDSYCQAIEEAGGLPVQFGFDKVYDKLSVLKPDAVLLPGGAFRTPDCWYGKFEGDDSVNDRTKAYQEMIRYAQEFRLPLLGICAGIQLLAVSFSSLLIQKLTDTVAAALTRLIPSAFRQVLCWRILSALKNWLSIRVTTKR